MAIDINGAPLEFNAVINAGQFNAAISAIERQLAGLTRSAEKEASAVENVVKKAAAGIAAYASFTTATSFISDVVKVRGEFQQLEVAFRTMLGSKEKADKLFKEAVDLAAKTPFTLQDVGNATKQLLAYGFAAGDITNSIKMLGNIASGVGAPLNDIIYLYGTLRTQGRAYQRDIMQFTSRGIPVVSELAKQFGVTEAEVTKLVEAGKVGFPEIERVMTKLTGAGGMFFNLMENQSKTLTGQLSNLQDAWSRMLNDIGKSNEGALSGSIEILTSLVNNYEKVLDVLKVLVITYGAYKAAVIVTNALTLTEIELRAGVTIATKLQYTWITITTRAQALLNKTMLANPYVLAATALAALTAGFIIFNRTATETKSKTELLAAANQKYADRFSEMEAKIRPYMDALKVANVSEQERVNIYEKLKAIDPKIVEGLTAKTIGYENLTISVNKYLSALRKQIDIDVNKEAILLSAKEEKNIKDKIEEQKKILKTTVALINDEEKATAQIKGKFGAAGATVRVIDDLKAQLREQEKITKQLSTTEAERLAKENDGKLRTIAVIEEEISNLKKLQKENSTTHAQKLDFDKQIAVKEAELAKIVGQSKQESKAAAAEENKALAMLEKRKGILEQIVDLQTRSRQSGQTKQLTELDKINEKYDTVLQNITEYNAKVDEFNKKNPKNQVQKIGQVDVVALNTARKKELDNQSLKDDAALYKSNLEKKQQLFEQYENAKKEVGIQKANEMFDSQITSYDSYLQYLQTEMVKLLPKIQFGIANIGEQNKFKAITDQISAYNQKKSNEELDQQKRNFIALLYATNTFNQQKAAINKKYDDLEKELSKNTTIADYAERKKVLENGRAEELQGLENFIIRSSSLYQKLNQDIIGFTRQRLREEIKFLKEKLKADTSLTPEIKANIQATIDRYKGLLDQTNEVGKTYKKVAEDLSSLSSTFGTLANSVSGLNSELGSAIEQLSQMASVGADAANAIASFSTGDTIGGIQSTVSGIAKIIDGFAKAKQSKIDAQNKILEFQQQVLAGEEEYNRIIRERQRGEIRANTLRLEGLQKEKKLLEEQKKVSLDTYNDILKKLQNESFISGQTTKKKGGGFASGLLGFLSGTRTEVINQLESLSGKSFAEIEKLFTSGQLTDSAKKLFEQLRAVKQEGVDIDALLKQNAEEAKQIFTGTTSESISDSIIEGFKNGKSGAAAFADDFQSLMQNAMLQSLKFKYLEGPLKEFFDSFAAASESGGQLTRDEIATLKNTYNNIINNASDQFKQLQSIAGINFSSSGGSAGSNSLQGAIKGITEQQAELLAGQFGGLRITAIEHLSVGRNQLTALNLIQINTSENVVRMGQLLKKFDDYETGSRKLNVKF